MEVTEVMSVILLYQCKNSHLHFLAFIQFTATFRYSLDMSSVVCLSSIMQVCCDNTTGDRITQFSLQNNLGFQLLTR